MASHEIKAPAAYVVPNAIAFGPHGNDATFVDHGTPLPVTAGYGAAASIPVSGTLSATGNGTVFTPVLGRAIWLTLSGVWAGTAVLERTTDMGATWLPATLGGTTLSWAENLNEPVGEETVSGAQYRLAFTCTSGTLVYRIEQ